MQLLDIITKNSVDRTLTLRMCDSSDGTPETGVTSATGGLDIWYRRQGGAKVSLTESDLSALTDAHSDGGMLHIADGVYRVDFPDAAFATGANFVDVGWGATGMVGFGGRIKLINTNFEDAVRMGMTALPNANAGSSGGSPTLNGAGQVSALVTGFQAGIITSSAFGSGAITATVLATDSITAAKLAPDVTTEIQTGLLTSSAFGTRMTGIEGSGFVTGDDSLEAIRNRGDAAWTTATSVTVSDKTGFALASNGLDSVVLPANLITAGAIAASALNGKGDWNVGKTGYALSASGLDIVVLPAGIITAGSVAAAALNGKGDWNVGKTGYSLAAGGLDSVVLPAGIITAASVAAAALNGKGDWNTTTPPTASAILNSTQMAEDYPEMAERKIKTLAQMLYSLEMLLSNFYIDGLNYTVRDVDGADVMVYQLDDADEPTSLVRIS